MHILGSTVWYNYLKGQLAIYTNILDLPNLRAKKSTFKNSPYRYKHINAQTHLCVKRCSVAVLCTITIDLLTLQ